MREIKFRGKRVDNGEWVFGDYGQFHKRDGDWTHEIHCPIPKISGSYWNEVIPETIGQFTGLHDKNGVEIYEGDVIRTHFSFSHEVAQEPFIIQWNKDKAMFEGVKKNPEQDEYLRSFSFFPEQLFLYEVIGNIHDQEEVHDEQQTDN